jgi:heptosyltransferase-2
MMLPIKRILIIRFRQIGDSILTLPLCSTLKKSFPEAEIHLILNKGIAALCDGHPDIDKVITFDKNELKPFYAYVLKVRQVVHEEKYDVIIDMRSTIRTLLFSLFSLHTPFRIGCTKSYAKFLLNYSVDTYDLKQSIDMVQRNLLLAKPLEKIRPIEYTTDFKLYINEEEKKQYREYMEKGGIRFDRPILLVGVTTKLIHKKWDKEYMKNIIKRIITEYKDIQIIFNYAPGYEEEDARSIYQELGCPTNIKIDIQANSLRQLVVLCSNCSFYFGNEGGTRHIAQAVNIPSFAIYSPTASKSMWLPVNSVPAQGISIDDLLSSEEKKEMTYQQQFAAITPEKIYEPLEAMLRKLN